MRKISHTNTLVQRLNKVLLLRALVLSTGGTSAGIGCSWLWQSVRTVASWDFTDVVAGSDLIVTSEDTQTVTTKTGSNFCSCRFKLLPYASNFSLQSELVFFLFFLDRKWFVTKAILQYPESCSPFFPDSAFSLEISFWECIYVPITWSGGWYLYMECLNCQAETCPKIHLAVGGNF